MCTHTPLRANFQVNFFGTCRMYDPITHLCISYVQTISLLCCQQGCKVLYSACLYVGLSPHISQKPHGQTRDVSSREISFLGLEAQIPGLVRVSIWTVVITLAKQRQRVCPGSVDRWRICRPRNQRRRATTPAAAAPAPSWTAKSPCDMTELPERRCCGGWSCTVKVR